MEHLSTLFYRLLMHMYFGGILFYFNLLYVICMLLFILLDHSIILQSAHVFNFLLVC